MPIDLVKLATDGRPELETGDGPDGLEEAPIEGRAFALAIEVRPH